jgi:hypothetical protein
MIGSLARNVAGIRASLGERGLMKARAWNLFDWAPLDTPPDGEVTHVNCLAVLGLRQAAELATAVKATAEAKAWDAFADQLAAAVNQHLWDDDRRAYIDCLRADGTRSPVLSQQTHTAAYIAGVAETPERHARCLEVMLKAPEGFVTAGSPFFMFFLLEGLAREGKFDDLVNNLRDYWGKQTDAGATTFWETYTPDEPRWTRSHCHGWSAAPTYFLTRYLLGISPAEPGFARVRVEPKPGAGGVRWARGRVPTPRGAVEFRWSMNADGSSLLSLSLPSGVPADVHLPAGTRVLETRRGAYIVGAAGGSNGLVTLTTAGPELQLTMAMPSAAK